MQIRFYTLLILISLFVTGLAQEPDSASLKQDSTQVKTQSKSNFKRNIFLGVDLYQPVLSAFTEKTSSQAFLSVLVKKQWHAVVEVGYESNTFNELNWNVDSEGIFVRLGFNYFLSKKSPNKNEGFYTGFRLAYSPYTQSVNEFPVFGSDISGNNSVTIAGPLEDESVSAIWVEPVVGARVQLFSSNFYADVSGRLQVPITNSNSIDPLVVPGYGKDVGGVNANLLWGISYKF